MVFFLFDLQLVFVYFGAKLAVLGGSLYLVIAGVVLLLASLLIAFVLGAPTLVIMAWKSLSFYLATGR